MADLIIERENGREVVVTSSDRMAILEAIEAAKVALQGNDTTATLTYLKQAIAEISIDTTDLAKEQTLTEGVAAIREDISHIDIDTTTLAKDATVAKEATLGASPEPAVSPTIFGWLKSIRDFLVGIVTTNPYAKEATLGDVQEVLEYIEEGGLPSITAIAKQGGNANANISDIQALIGYTITEIDVI